MCDMRVSSKLTINLCIDASTMLLREAVAFNSFLIHFRLCNSFRRAHEVHFFAFTSSSSPTYKAYRTAVKYTLQRRGIAKTQLKFHVLMVCLLFHCVVSPACCAFVRIFFFNFVSVFSSFVSLHTRTHSYSFVCKVKFCAFTVVCCRHYYWTEFFTAAFFFFMGQLDDCNSTISEHLFE